VVARQMARRIIASGKMPTGSRKNASAIIEILKDESQNVASRCEKPAFSIR
jgi:uncharacterized protein (UPF0147 family)